MQSRHLPKASQTETSSESVSAPHAWPNISLWSKGIPGNNRSFHYLSLNQFSTQSEYHFQDFFG